MSFARAMKLLSGPVCTLISFQEHTSSAFRPWYGEMVTHNANSQYCPPTVCVKTLEPRKHVPMVSTVNLLPQRTFMQMQMRSGTSAIYIPVPKDYIISSTYHLHAHSALNRHSLFVQSMIYSTTKAESAGTEHSTPHLNNWPVGNTFWITHFTGPPHHNHTPALPSPITSE